MGISESVDGSGPRLGVILNVIRLSVDNKSMH
jgi:hypothetical protein